MPQKLDQYLKELEGFRDRALKMHDVLKTNPFMDYNHLWIWKKK